MPCSSGHYRRRASASGRSPRGVPQWHWERASACLGRRGPEARVGRRRVPVDRSAGETVRWGDDGYGMAGGSSMSITDRGIRRREFLASGSAGLVAAAFARTEAFAARQELSERIRGVRAMTFDVFGTVVDWRTSITREGEAVGRRKGIEADWAAFADDWRGGYGPAMGRVRRGELGWTKIDDLHRMILDELVPKYGLESLTEEELGRPEPRLAPPDPVARHRRGADAAAPALRAGVAVERQRGPARQHGEERGHPVGRGAVGRAGPALQARPRGLPDRGRPAGPRARAVHDGGRPQGRPPGVGPGSGSGPATSPAPRSSPPASSAT